MSLRLVITIKGRAPSAEEYEAPHHAAHEECYVANSVNFPVTVTPEIRFA